MLDRVFELFEQQPQALDRSAGGLGLGLAIVRSLVHMHSGRVRAISQGIGHGSEFIVELPLAAAVAQSAAVVSSPALGPDLPRGDGEHVLVVDDNEDAARLLYEALTALGYRAHIAMDGPRALSVADEFPPAVGVLDLGLPVMDGYELGRKLRSLASLQRMRIVAVTGYGQASDQKRSHAAGFDAHLVKPVQLSRLVSLFEALLPADPADASPQG
jgi:CheY-like chemotaxis protein